MKNGLWLGPLLLLSAVVWIAVALIIVVWIFTPTNTTIKTEEITIMSLSQPVRKCYSAFDIYLTDAYEIVDDNVTLITSYGRVYNLSECKLIKGK